MAKKRNILIVDDEQPTIDSLELLLSENFHLLVACSGEEAICAIKSEPIDLAFLDISLPGMDGFEVLREIKRCDESIDVVMLTADEKAKTAMRAMELGAFHYITKPYDKDDILLVTRRVFEKKHMAEEIMVLRDEVKAKESFHRIIGQDPKMKEIFHLITKVASTDTSVLITGESGTGKELVAAAIHDQSLRKSKPFKAINCGAIPESLLESELFGHEKGAFTGASEKKIGKFEIANGGTIFLDEISAMNKLLQIKLLRVLQEREIERVGGIKAIPIDVRILAATNAHLEKLVENDEFRGDLYYRINVLHLHLPPLRERKEDILLLAEHFLRHYGNKFSKTIVSLSSEAKNMLKHYSWPGNVRELKNVMERAVVLADGSSVEKNHLPFNLCMPQAEFSPPTGPFFLKSVIDDYERKVILIVLERTDWNQTKTAEILGIHRNTLLLKLDSLGINVKQKKEERSAKVLV